MCMRLPANRNRNRTKFMRIVQVTPGSGDNFYCENCIRDITITKELKRQGVEVVMVPLYLPPRLDVGDTTRGMPVFFGGINVYLQQKFGLFRRTPGWVDRWFNAPGLLNWAAKKAGMTTARELGETTASMLRGEHGRQAKELQKLLDWLKEYSPDILCLSNILLAGLAGQIREQLKIPVVCLLQDEDGFLDSLPEPLREEAWELVRQRAAEMEAFIAVSTYYAGVMRERLSIPAERMHIVYSGIDTAKYAAAAETTEPPVIGFLSRMCFSKGLDILVDAFIRIKKEQRLSKARLRIAGGKTSNDEAFIGELQGRLEAHGCGADAEFLSPFDQQSRIEFLQSLSLMCVPEREGEACGLYLMEALAAGVPFAQPDNGVSPELRELTGGGILYSPNDAETLAGKLQKVLLNPQERLRMARQGREAAVRLFGAERMAGELLKIYQTAVTHFEGR